MNINPIVLSIPVFFVLIGIELLVERFTNQKLYRMQDAVSNISSGITSELSALFLRIFGIDMKRIPLWPDKFKYMCMKPGWLPYYPGGYRSAPAVTPETSQKYNTPSPLALNLYLLFQYILCLIGTALFLFHEADFMLVEKRLIAALITVTVVNCGVLFEQRKGIIWAEWLRIFVYPLLLIMLTLWFDWPVWYHPLAFVYFIISATWFYSFQRQHEHLQIA